ncbi:hypothetical protein U1Q18_020581, partial [Sarracenia purpurea var. burkii]
KNQKKHREGEGRIPTEKSCRGWDGVRQSFWIIRRDDLRGGKREVDRRKQRHPAITGERKKSFLRESPVSVQVEKLPVNKEQSDEREAIFRRFTASAVPTS